MAGEKILIVEDEPVSARGLEYRLITEGFQVSMVETGKAAIESVKDSPPDLILTDIQLPDIGGMDLCAQLRKLGWHMPILIFTSQKMTVDSRAGLEINEDDFILKPYSLREVVSRIQRRLEAS